MSDSTIDWSKLDMSELVFLGEDQLAAYDVDLLPPPGDSSASLVVAVDPEVLDQLIHEAADTGRSLDEVVQGRLRRPAA